MSNQQNLRAAFETFLDEALQEAAISSTRASWGGGGYSVELLPDGSYRVLCDDSIGNLYVSPGIILRIPPLGDEEWIKDADVIFLDNVETALRDNFQEALEDLTNPLNR